MNGLVKNEWDLLSESPLTEEEVELYQDQLNWLLLSKNEHISASTYLKFFDQIDWNEMACSRKNDLQFILQMPLSFSSQWCLVYNHHTQLTTDEWFEVGKANGIKLFGLSNEEKREILRSQIIHPFYLDTHAMFWGERDWEVISIFQMLDFDFVNKFAKYIHTKRLHESNRHLLLTEEQIEQIREKVSTILDREIEDGVSHDITKLEEKHLLTNTFLEKYQPKKTKSMFKADLIKTISAKTDSSEEETKIVLEAMYKVIADKVKKERP